MRRLSLVCLMAIAATFGSAVLTYLGASTVASLI